VYEGRLAGYEGGRVKLGVGEVRLIELEFSNISKARLVVEEPGFGVPRPKRV